MRDPLSQKPSRDGGRYGGTVLTHCLAMLVVGALYGVLFAGVVAAGLKITLVMVDPNAGV